MKEFELLRKVERVEQIQKMMQDTLAALQVSYNEDSFAKVNSEISRIKDILKKKISGGVGHNHSGYGANTVSIVGGQSLEISKVML